MIISIIHGNSEYIDCCRVSFITKCIMGKIMNLKFVDLMNIIKKYSGRVENVLLCDYRYSKHNKEITFNINQKTLERHDSSYKKILLGN